MTTFNSVFGSVDISTRPKRRRVVSLIITELSHIRNEEERYLERIPSNMHTGDAYAAAEDSVDMMTNAIVNLIEAY
jgi:hypothetical protein